MRWDNRGKVKRRRNDFLKWRFRPRRCRGYQTRELQQRRRPRQQKRQKLEAIGLILASINFARASHFFVHFFAVTARLRCEIVYFYVLWRTQTSDDEFLFLFLNLSAVPKKSTPGKFAYIWHFQRKGINATKFGKKREFIFKMTFSLPSPLSIVKLPAPYDAESAGVDWKRTPGACSRVVCVIPKTPWALRRSKKRTPFVNGLFV